MNNAEFDAKMKALVDDMIAVHEGQKKRLAEIIVEAEKGGVDPEFANTSLIAHMIRFKKAVEE